MFAKSIWEESRQTLTQPLFGPLETLTKANYDAAIDLLIPRAVAYSTGILQYAFRGRLEVKPPDEGVYSLVDHYDFSGDMKPATNAASGFKGFKTIKLKLRNTTPNEGMPGGTLVAVLKFYRHLGYVDNLSAEPNGDNALAVYSGNRSTNEEIVVSSRVKNAAGVELPAAVPVSNTAETFIFEFDQELPINAVDVRLQVVYRGPLGSEADAVVVQTADISEPSYFAYLNASDYIKIGGGVYTRDCINSNGPPTDTCAGGASLRAQIAPGCLNSDGSQLLSTCFQPFAIDFPLKWWNPAPGSTGVAQTNLTLALPADRTYSRVAMLTPNDAPAVVDQSASVLCQPNTALQVPGRQLQTDVEGNPPANVRRTLNVFPPPPPSGVRDRGVYSWVISCVNNGDNSPPDSPDNRATIMTALPMANLKPVQTIGFKFGAP